MKVYISAHALTRGIIEKDAQIFEDGVVRPHGLYERCYYHEGKDWHRTREEAVKRAKEMREKEIERLKRKIKKLEGLKFDGKEASCSRIDRYDI